MKKVLSAALPVMTILLPVSLIIAFSYWGPRHPAEGKVIDDLSFLNDSSAEVAVIFFGYVGCESICPTSLAKLAGVMDELDNQIIDSRVSVYFLDINNESSNSAPTQSYASFFSPHMYGLNVPALWQNKVADTFRLNVSSSATVAGKIYHTDHFYVLKKSAEKWKIQRVLDNNSESSLIKNTLINALTGQT